MIERGVKLFIIIFLGTIGIILFLNHNFSNKAVTKIYGQVFYIENSEDTQNQVILSDVVDKKFDLNYVLKNETYLAFKYLPNKIVYIYIPLENSYQKIIISYNIEINDSVQIQIPDNTKEIYYSFPEYTATRAVTVNMIDSINEICNITIIEKSNDEPDVGGNMKRRVYLQENCENDLEVKFAVYSEFNSNQITQNSEIYGIYDFVLVKK